VGEPDAARNHVEQLADGRVQAVRQCNELRALREQRRRPAHRPGQHRRRAERERDGAAAAERVEPPGDNLRRRHARPLSERYAGREQGADRHHRRVHRRNADRRERRLGRVLSRPDRRGPHL
jgi:hypothetical protein